MSVKGYRVDENISKSLENLEKSVKDKESIDANLRDEVKAVSSYNFDAHETKDPKVKKLFNHIKKEEEEHQEELEEALGKSTDMYRPPKYSTPFSTKTPSVRTNTGALDVSSTHPASEGETENAMSIIFINQFR